MYRIHFPRPQNKSSIHLLYFQTYILSLNAYCHFRGIQLRLHLICPFRNSPLCVIVDCHDNICLDVFFIQKYDALIECEMDKST